MSAAVKSVLVLLLVLTVSAGCGSENSTNSFKINLPKDPALLTKTRAVLPAVLNACPGLNKYAGDFSVAEVGLGSMRDYEGGIEITFAVTDRPHELPSSIRTRSMGQTCYLNVKPDGSKIYIGKSGCHSICDGTPHENDPGSMGRAMALR
jgi:hypothetical protein